MPVSGRCRLYKNGYNYLIIGNQSQGVRGKGGYLGGLDRTFRAGGIWVMRESIKISRRIPKVATER